MTTQYFKVRNGLSVGEDAVAVNGTTGAITVASAFTLPVTDGAANAVLTTNGAGVVTWALPGGGGSTFGNVTVGVATDNTVSTTTGDLVVDSATGIVTMPGALTVTGVATTGDSSRVLGQLIATRNATYTPPTTPLTTQTGQNGVVISSSTGGANGYGASMSVRYHSGDTSATTASAAAVALSGATGTSSSPAGIVANQVAGTLNYDGYTAGTSNNYASQIATMNQGAGTGAVAPLQAQAYARQAFTNSTTVTTAVTGASGTGSVATLSFTAQNTAPYVVGQTVTIAGMTPSGYNGTVVLTAATTSSISYANATTGFTSGGTIGAANTVTAGGMGFRIRGFANSANLTAANRFNFMDLTASAATFKSNAYTFANEVITGSTLTATNYMTLGATLGSINQDTFTLKNTAGTTTYVTLASSGISMGNVDGLTTFIRASGANVGTRPVAFLRNTVTATTTPATADGASFRLQAAGSNGTAYSLAQFSGVYSSAGDTAFTVDIANGDQNGPTMTVVQPMIVKLSETRIRGTTSPTATAGGNTLTDVAIFTPANTTIKSDAITLQTNAGSTLAVVDANTARFSVPVTTEITSTTISEGTTYTPAATSDNNISVQINSLAGGTTIIDLASLTGNTRGGSYNILVFNNTGSGAPIQVKNTRINTNNLTTHTITTDDRIIINAYVVGDYATADHLLVA